MPNKRKTTKPDAKKTIKSGTQITIKIQPAPKTGKISIDKIQRAVDSVSKPKKKK